MIHSICVFGGVFPRSLPLLEFSVDGLPHTSANSVPFRGTIGPISDQSRTNLGQLHLARTHVATIKPPPADLPPACPSMLTVRPTPLPPIHCTSWIMRTLYLFSSGVLLWGSAGDTISSRNFSSLSRRSTAPRSRSDFRCNLANEIQSRLATSHRSAGGRRAHLPY